METIDGKLVKYGGPTQKSCLGVMKSKKLNENQRKPIGN